MLPFTNEQFFEVFRTYNAAVWQAHLVAYAMSLLALAFLVKPGATSDRATSVVLGLMWLWTGVAYHWLWFAAVNPAALLFGAGFVAQGAALLYAGGTRKLVFGAVGGVRGAAGLALILYAAVVYPIVGVSLGNAYAALPLFGITPCPVTLFTFGCLLLTKRPVPSWILPVPVLWSLVGGSAAFLLEIPQDWPLLLSGPAAALVLLRRTGAAPVEGR